MTASPAMNSTTYVDLLGILVGLERMQGETSGVFAERVARAGVLKRTADYVGLMNELHLQFGFDLSRAISITSANPYDLWVDLAGVHLRSGFASVDSPLVAIGPEDFWEWRALSQIVTDLNTAGGVTATLLIGDAPAFQLPSQSNTMLVVGEAIQGSLVHLAHPGFQSGSEAFSALVPKYSVRADSVLEFDHDLPTGMRISYRYKLTPYTLISSPVFLLSMVDPNLGAVASAPDGAMAYQMREFIQELAGKDRSYWAQ
jgi:hypothetical protein